MSDMFMFAKQLVKGYQTLVMDPTGLLQQSLVTTVPHTIMVHWYLLGSGQEFQDLTQKSGLTFWPHIIDVWHVLSVCVAGEVLSDLGNGPNQPTATTIGEYSASYHDGALTSTWFRARISGSQSQESGLTFWPHIIDVWHVHSVYIACEGLSDLGNGPI